MKFRNAFNSFIFFSLLILMPFIFFIFFPHNSYSASFDCQKSKTFIERTICASPKLSSLDDQLALVYMRALESTSDQNEIRKNQRNWLRNIRNVCQNEECLIQTYEQRIQSIFLISVKQPQITAKQNCEFPDLVLPKDYMLFAAGGYLGRRLDFRIDDAGITATQVDVTVNFTSKPVVLMLGDYEPTIWNISWTPGTHIIAVLATGYYRQAIAGLEPNVSTMISTFQNQNACGYFYVDGIQKVKVDPMAQLIFYRPVDMFYPTKEAKVVIGQPLSDNSQLITSHIVSPESYNDSSLPLTGLPALEAAVNMGLLRRVTDSDADNWEEAISEKRSKNVKSTMTDSDRRKNPLKLNINRSFVVLKPFKFPSGLTGEPAIFLIPKGVKIPEGDPGFSAIFDINSMSCYGAICSAFDSYWK